MSKLSEFLIGLLTISEVQKTYTKIGKADATTCVDDFNATLHRIAEAFINLTFSYQRFSLD